MGGGGVKIPPVERPPQVAGRCGCWLVFKNRYCKCAPLVSGSKYCGNHCGSIPEDLEFPDDSQQCREKETQVKTGGKLRWVKHTKVYGTWTPL